MQRGTAATIQPVEAVSSETDRLILVDRDDNPIGELDKARCHDGAGVLHRAFSLFIFNSRGELLLQQRGFGKRLWPGYWSNSCCSHPRVGESMPVAIQRRLLEELGLQTALEYLYKFEYHAQFGTTGSEHELCSVYVGFTDAPPRPHPGEIEALRWICPANLDAEFLDEAAVFTPWFRLEWQTLRDQYRDRLVAPAGG